MFVDVQGGCIVGDDAPASRGAFVNAPCRVCVRGGDSSLRFGMTDLLLDSRSEPT